MLLFLAFIALQVSSAEDNGGFLQSLLIFLSAFVVGGIFFTCIALHELGHSFVAIRKGCRVHEITLMFMGGAAKMDKMPSRPLDEFLMAIAGPAVSLFIGIISIGSGMLIHTDTGAREFIGQMVLFIGIINIIIAVFNLIPAFPMDGGRVFRALLTPRYGRVQATYIASRLGRAIAIAFFIIGIFGLKNFAPFGYPFNPWNPFLIVISIFIFINADREFRMVQYEELMKQRNTTGGNIWSSIFGNMQPPPQSPPPPPPSEPMDDSVHISPPPYAKGPDAHTNLHQTNEPKNPFKSLFGR